MPDIEPIVTDVAAPADAATPDAAPEWDGSDWSALDKQPWWSQVPESARKHITAAHEERTSAKERSDYLDRLFTADDDSVRRDLVAAQTEAKSLKEALAGIEARTAEEAEDREYERMSAKFADIWSDIHPDEKGELQQKGAYVKFVKLLQSGFDEDEAAAMARAVMINKPAATEAGAAAATTAAAPAKTREVQIPKAIANASKGGNNPSATINAKEAGEDLAQRAQRLKKQYEAEEAAES
jgi:hypothetical protein